MKKKKTKLIGYIYQTEDETLQEALSHYMAQDFSQSLYSSLKETKRQINYDLKNGMIDSDSKPKIIKLLVEEVK